MFFDLERARFVVLPDEPTGLARRTIRDGWTTGDWFLGVSSQRTLVRVHLPTREGEWLRLNEMGAPARDVVPRFCSIFPAPLVDGRVATVLDAGELSGLYVEDAGGRLTREGRPIHGVDEGVVIPGPGGSWVLSTDDTGDCMRADWPAASADAVSGPHHQLVQPGLAGSPVVVPGHVPWVQLDGSSGTCGFWVEQGGDDGSASTFLVDLETGGRTVVDGVRALRFPYPWPVL